MTALADPVRTERDESAPGAPRRRRDPLWPVVAVLAATLAVIAVASAGVGAYSLTPGTVIRGLLQGVGLEAGAPLSATDRAVLWDIRLPRIALAVLVGGALGCAGALMQGVFRNPLAEPGAVGVSAGAALGAVTVLAFGGAAFGEWSVPAAAFAGGLATTYFVYRFARWEGRTEVVTLVLTGIAVNSFAGALIGLMTFFSDDAALRSITFWSLGSMSAATWSIVLTMAPLAAIGLAVAPTLARPLDLLALGEREAGHLGANTGRVRNRAILLIAVLTAGSVAAAGVVTFVGLVVPHLVRLALGPAHRVLLPASVLGSAILVLLADLIARTAVAPVELPLGVLTAVLGGPFFLWLIARARREAAGWA